MKWNEMDDKERVRLVLQHVMGYFVLEATATGWHTPEFPRGTSAPAGFHWPIAFWNTDGECWMTRDIATDPTCFDPLHDLNDAWQIVEHMKKRVVDEYGNRTSFADLSTEIEDMSDNGSISAVLWGLTPERICIAALKAVGVEIGE